jgi:hypothetical protein
MPQDPSTFWSQPVPETTLRDDADVFWGQQAHSQQQAQGLRQAVSFGLDQNPDEYAKFLRTAAKTGVAPALAKDFRPELDKAVATRSFDFDQMVSTAPVLSAALSNPHFAAVAHDDGPTLASIEKAFGALPASITPAQKEAVQAERFRVASQHLAAGGGEAGSLLASSTKAAFSLPSLVYKVLGSAAGVGEAAVKSLGDLTVNYHNQALGDLWQQLKGNFSGPLAPDTLAGKVTALGSLDRLAQGQLVGPQEILQDQAGRKFKNPDYAWWGRGLVNSAESIPGALLGMAGFGPATAPLMSAEGMVNTFEQARGEGATGWQALARGSVSAALNYALMGGGVPASPVAQSFWGKAATWGGRGAGLGLGMNVIENEAARLTNDPNRSLFQGAPESMATMLAWEAIPFLHATAEARQSRAFLETMATDATASKLRERMPEMFRDYVKRAAEGTEVENLGIPAEKFTTLFQSLGKDPREMAAALHIGNYDEALASGTDLQVPVEHFAEKIAPDPQLMQGLIDDVRIRPGDMTTNELRDHAGAVEGMHQDLLGQAERARGEIAADPSKGRIFEEIKQQMVAVGYEPGTAEAYALAYTPVITNLAQRQGQDPMALHEKYGLQVFRPRPGEEVTDAILRNAQDRAAAGQDQGFLQGPAPAVPPRGVHFNDLAKDHQARVVAGIEQDIQRWADHPEEFSSTYEADPETFGGRLVNGDIMRRLLPTVADNVPLGLEASKHTDAAIESLLVTLRNRVIDRALDLAGDKPVGITAGGQASGKTSLAEHYLNAGILGAVIDAPHDDARSVQLVLGKILARNKDAEVVYVDRPDFKAAFRSMINRAIQEGRMVDLQDMIDKHLKVPAEMLKVGEANRNSHRVGMSHVLNPEAGGWQFIGGRLADQGKDALASIRNRENTNHEVLVSQAKEAYLEHQRDVQNGTAHPIPADLRRTLEASFPGGTFQDGSLPGGDPRGARQERGQASDLQPELQGAGAGGSAPEAARVREAIKALGISPDGDVGEVKRQLAIAAQDPANEAKVQAVVQAIRDAGGTVLFQPPKDMSFGSKGWQEFYGLTKGARPAAGDLAKRARAALKASLTEKGQREFDAQRALEQRTDEELFKAWEAGIKDLQAGQVLGEDNRGFLQFGEDRKMSIGLLPNADLSTFLHESHHMYVEILGDLAKAPDAPEQIRADYQTLREFAGAKGDEPLTTEQHETLARAGEAYLMEGKAPSEALQPVFQRFKGWLMLIYQKLSNLGVMLTPQVRGVFDRLYATDQEIEHAQARQGGGDPLFTTAEQMGKSQAEFDLYQRSIERAKQAGEEALGQKLQAEFMREYTRSWKQKRDQVREEVAAQLSQDPVYRAQDVLAKGEMEDGTPIKLDRAQLVERIGEEATKALERENGKSGKAVYARDGGLDLELAAELLGFRSGDELAQGLRDMEPRGAAIDRLADQEMKSRHGDMLTDGTLADAAVEAIHNRFKEEAQHMELAALRAKAREVAPFVELQRKIGEAKTEEERLQAKAAWEAVKADQARKAKEARAQALAATQAPPLSVFRDAARESIARTAVKDLQPIRYLDGERKAAGEAILALAKDDYQAAADARQKSLLNHFLYREAVKAKAGTEAIVGYAQKFSKSSVRQRIAKAGGDRGELVYLAQIDGLLERFRFVPESNKAIQARQESLVEFALTQRQAGEDLVIDPALFNEQPRNYRELTLPELETVRDALKNIETVAKNQLGYLKDGKRVSLEEQAKIFDEIARANNKAKPVARAGTEFTLTEKAGRYLRGFDSYMLKMEWLVDQLDGGDINGPARENIKRPIDEAAGRRNAMGKEIFNKLKDLVEARPEADRKDIFESTGVTFPGMERPLNRLQLVSWALNLGTEENRKVAILGEGLMNEDGSLRPEFDQALGALRKSELAFVQGTWDILAGMLPSVKEAELRITGLEPELKTVTPFTVKTAEGEEFQMQGGYYPQKADHVLSDIGRRQQDPAKLATGNTRPTTSTSHATQVTGATYRLLLDYQYVLGQHLNDVINRATTGEAINQVFKFISNKEVFKTIQETLGEKEAGEFLPWLQAFANNRKADPNEGGPALRWLMARRTGMVVARLAGNLTSYLIQTADVLKAFADPDVKSAYLAKAFLDIRMAPEATIEQIKGWSPNEMRFRDQNFNREMKDMLEAKSLFNEKRTTVSEWLMQGFQVMDRLVTYPVWLARYRQGLDAHGNPEQAVREADRIIGRDFQAGEDRNMSRMMREPGMMKLLTTFQGDANTWYNIISASIRSGKVSRISLALLMLVGEQVASQALRNRLPGEGEDKTGWLAHQALVSALSKLGPMGDFAQFGVDKTLGKYATLQNPTMASIEKSLSAGKSIADYAQDKKDFQEASQDVVEAAGLWAGIPLTAPSIRGWRYVHKVQKGDENPANALELTKGMVFGPPPKKK